MRNLVIFLFCLFSALGINAQNFRYVHSIGLGTEADEDLLVVTDNDGNVYEVGDYSDMADLDPGAGSFFVNPIYPWDMGTYLVKKDSAGNFIWGRQLPRIFISSLNYNPLGRLIIAGNYNNEPLDIDPGPLTTYLDSFPCGGMFLPYACGAAFIAEFDSSGNFEWARSLISHHDLHLPEIKDVETDASGNVYVTGYYYDSLDVDPGPGTFWLTTSGPKSEMFLLKLDFAGNFLWAEQMTGSGQEIPYALSITGTGDLLMAGFFQRIVDFDPGIGTALRGTPTTDGNMFLLKLTADGNFISVKDFINTGDQYFTDMELDPEDNIYLTGYANDSVDFDPGLGTYILPTYSSSTYDKDIFVMKLDFNENFLWAKRIGPGPDNHIPMLDVDLVGNVYTAGTIYTSGVDLDPGPGIYLGTSTSMPDVETFIQKLDADGNFEWARVWNIGYASKNICLDNFYNIYLSGLYNGTVDFDPNTGVYNMTGQMDGYLLKLGQKMGHVTSIANLHHQLVQLFPNPTNGNITVFTGEQTAQNIIVTDVSGRMIYTIRPYSPQTTIDLSELSSGVYFATTYIGNSPHTVKLIKTDR